MVRRAEGGEFVFCPPEIKSRPNARRHPALLDASINTRQKWNDKRVAAKEETLLSILPDQRVPAHPLKVPARAVAFGKDNQVRALGVLAREWILKRSSSAAFCRSRSGARLKSVWSSSGVAEKRKTRAMLSGPIYPKLCCKARPPSGDLHNGKRRKGRSFVGTFARSHATPRC